MKKLFVAALKFVLLVSLLAVIGFLTFGLVLWMDWPWWVGLCFGLAYFGLYLLWVLLRKILLRRREKHFVNEVIAQDEAYRRQQGEVDGVEQDLQVRWKEAIETLNRSQLGKSGNPLYVLPWYMVIGESRSGKTTAIQSAGLSSPFAETRKTAGLGGTKNCDWWFFEQAVILDTAGRYAIPLEEGRDRKEWQKFLSLLAKYRKREAINGLVVTIAADKLLSSATEVLAEDGHLLRQRIDELMRVIGIKFPVYVLVTKCDLVQGMTQFCDKLPEKSLRQAMGRLNAHLSRDVIDFLQQALATVEEKLRNLRLRLMGSQQPGAPLQETDPGLLLFPLEFGNVKKNLQVFIESAFKENPYQETPLLRGIYFSSGRQEGTPYSHFLSELGLIKQQEVLPGTNRGLFLHDLFATIMAGDRYLYAPTRKAMAWSRLTRNIGLTAWMALVLALCGLLSYSFVKNLTTLRTVADTFSQPVALQGETLTDISIMERFQGGVRHIEAINDRWWFPRLGLKQSLYVEERIKQRFCAQFKDEFVTDFDRQLALQGAGLSAQSPDEDTARYVMHLTYRINLIKSRLEGSGLNRLNDLEQPPFQYLLSAADSRLVNQIGERIATQYRHYLAWQDDEQQLNREKSQLQKQLHQALSLPGANLNWLVAWINRDERFEGLTLEHFWGPILERQDLASVPAAFTMAGKKEVDRLLKQIEQAVSDNLVIAGNKTRFAAWYSQAYRHIWYDFARIFPQAEYYLRDRDAWQQAASIMALDKGPYFGLIKRMHEELRGIDESQDDDWLALLRLIEKISVEAKTEKAIEEQKSMIAKVAKKGKSAISTIEKGLGNSGVGQTLEAQMIGGKYFNDYRNGLSDLVLATSSRNVSFQMASDIFSQDPATSEAPMYVAQRNLIRLRNELAPPAAPQETQVIWKLVAGPLTFLRDYAYLEAACRLNTLWEENVLVEVQGIRDKTELNEVFFNDNGLALKFVRGPAAPFLGRSLEQGFYPRKALGRMVPFRQEFLTFLTEGIRLSRYKPDLRISDEVPLAVKQQSTAPAEPKLKESYEVVLEARPTSVNKGAKMVPHAVSLEMTCSAEVTRLLNLQYPVRQKFIWKPETCQSLSLKVEIGSLLLEKNYEGEQSFARFIKEYQSGAATYTPLDFPDKEKFLKRLNVRTITVKFKAVSGAEPLIRFVDQLEAYNKAMGISDKPGAGQDGPNMAEVLLTLESRRKAEELENEAMKKAWKGQQLKRAAEIKQQWEQQLPDVPRDISICWD